MDYNDTGNTPMRSVCLFSPILSPAIDLLDEAGASVHIEHAFNPSGSTNTPEVTDQDISSIISQWTNIPIGKLTSTESSTLLTLESSLASRVKGQERAIKSIARAVRRARSGLRDAGRPVASFLFCGSTGVGKTWLAKSLAAQYYGSEKDMVRQCVSVPLSLAV